MEAKKSEIQGVIFSGKGEGQYFLSLPGYQKRIQGVVGFRPFAGTLNLKVDPIESTDFLGDFEPIDIAGFSESGRNFGSLKLYQIQLNGERVYIVVPEKSSYHGDVLEIIAEANLRQKFQLRDGDQLLLINSLETLWK